MSVFELDRRDVTERLVQPVVVNQLMYSTTPSSSWLRVRHTRSAISSVLNESTKLSAVALGFAVNCA